MKIIGYVNRNSGVSFHRIIAPLMTMPDVDVFVTNDLQEEHFAKGCDLFLYNRVLPGRAIPKINELKEKYGFKICVDIDDYWELDPHHILFDEYKKVLFANQQIQSIINADVVTCTHSRLADEIKPYNKNVHVLPNAIPKQGQFIVEREPSKFTRLFWQGSDTHAEDIAILRNPMYALSYLSPKIKMIMGGYVEGHPSWYDMVMNFTANLKHQYNLLPFTGPSDYYQQYKHADVCLIPLLETRFNAQKSNLKVLEAANLGLPVICSAVHPYKGLPVIYAKNTNDWVTGIKRLTASKNRQKEAGQELKEFCDVHYNFDKINKERKQILTHLKQTA